VNRYIAARSLVLLALGGGGAACSGGPNGTPSVGGEGAGQKSRALGDIGSSDTRPGAGLGGRGSRGGRGTTVVLAANDVATVQRGTIEITTPVSGELRPVEDITVRARIEGDITAVLVREGNSVERGALLARFDSSELETALVAARADAAAARSDSVTAEWNLEQSRELFRAGAISEQNFRAAEQAAFAARARSAAAAARLLSAEVSRRDAQVLAPATGTVAQRFVQTGERVARGAQLFSLVRDDTLEFTAAVPARAASTLRVGQEVRFAVDGRNFTGRLARVSPEVDPASRSVAVFVRVPNTTRSLRANSFAAGRVVSAERRGVLTMPLEAVRRSRDEDAPFAYRIEGEIINTAPVRLGQTDEARGLVEVLDGLAEHDQVVVGNVGTIGRGMRVQILDSERRSGRGSNQ
jgi:membrane fusion protein (multidrug efflux system)